MTPCEGCRLLLNQDSKSLATDVENAFADCVCEKVSVGVNSPGPIEDTETLYRMFTDPVDVDEEGRLAREAFKTALTNGLSVIRAQSTDEEVAELVMDILSVKPDRQRRTILAIFEVPCTTVRFYRSMYKGHLGRTFCVYDQTVPRILQRDLPPVRTHGIVLSRRLHEGSKRKFENDANYTLHELVAIRKIPVESFRNGMIMALNERSLRGEFVRAAD